jgi:hypothetical protein
MVPTRPEAGGRGLQTQQGPYQRWSGLNVFFTKTLKKMKLDITHMLTKSTSPFYGIVPGNVAIPLGSVVLPVTFGETRDN